MWTLPFNSFISFYYVDMVIHWAPSLTRYNYLLLVHDDDYKTKVTIHIHIFFYCWLLSLVILSWQIFRVCVRVCFYFNLLTHFYIYTEKSGVVPNKISVYPCEWVSLYVFCANTHRRQLARSFLQTWWARFSASNNNLLG